jgi:hypothetical protein
MTLLELFLTCYTSTGYKKTILGADWKIINNSMYFQQTKSGTDWLYNFLSLLKFPSFIFGKLFFMPLGPLLMFKSLRRIIKKHPVDMYVGYSQGGWFASYASALTQKKAITFGCPKLGIGDREIFNNVTHYKNPFDIVSFFPMWALCYGKYVMLNNDAEKPKNMTNIEWNTGHTKSEYEQRLKGLKCV